jgi:hypothetical protein
VNPVRGINPLVTTYEGLESRLQVEDGRFYATPKGRGDRPVYDKTLDGLKAKLNNFTRAQARVQAANLPAVVLELGREYDSESEPVTTAVWREGIFTGIHAHTGAVGFKENGKESETDGYFFRPDDPALPEIRVLAVTHVQASRAASRARKALNAALRRHGQLPRIGYAKDKTLAAAKLEAEMIEHLTPPDRGEEVAP